MDLEDVDSRARFLVRDRDSKFTQAFDTVLTDARLRVVNSGVRMPQMNSTMERWIQTCRRELLDRTLIWDQRHLLHALREFERFYNCHRPHPGNHERPAAAHCPHLSRWRTSTLASAYRDATASAASSTSTSMPLNLHG